MKIPYIKPCVDRYADKILSDVSDIIKSNRLTNIPDGKVKGLENWFDQYADTNTAAVSSCTSGLILVLKALGLNNTDIIIPSFTFKATGAAVLYSGNHIKFADIDPMTYTISPEDVRLKITSKTGAIIGVHTFGNPCDINELVRIGKDYGIPVIFDSAHGLGARYQGFPLGRFGTAEVFSLSPTKLVTSLEGGLVSSEDEELIALIKDLRNYGSLVPGLNARMNEVNAAVALAQTPYLDQFVSNRNEYANRYRPNVSCQSVMGGNVSSFKDLSITVDDPNSVATALAGAGIETRRYFSPLHRMIGYKRDVSLPDTDDVFNHTICVPIHNYMTQDEIDYILTILHLELDNH